MRWTVLSVAILMVAALAGCAAPDASPPEWSFVDTDGEIHDSADAQGSPTLLFFMATWCSDCRRKAPMVAQVHGEFSDAGLTTFSVTTDPTYDSNERLAEWKESLNQTWPHGRDWDGSMLKVFDVRSQSTLVVLRADGHVQETIAYGQGTLGSIRGAVEGAFDAK